jgi:D-arginine dehydrogenase
MFRQLYRHPQLTEWAEQSRLRWTDEIKEKFFQETGSLIVGRNAPAHHQYLFEEKTIITPSDDETSSVYTRTDGLLDSPSYVQHLYSKCNPDYTTFSFACEIASINHKSNLWELHCNDGRSFEANTVVNAAGAWINSFLCDEQSQLQAEAQAYARHLFVVEGWDEGYMPSEECGYYWSEDSAWYMRRWDADSRLVSICDQVAADPNNFCPSPNREEILAHRLSAELPQQSQQLRLGRGWHCFRTYTEDQLPIFGFDDRASGFFWLAAFGGFGMSTSFAASLDAARLICGEQVAITKEFLPNRAAPSIRKLGNE